VTPSSKSLPPLTPLLMTPSRLFVSIATRGCGSGCSYCFISHPDDSPHYFSPNQILDSMDTLNAGHSFLRGVNGTLVSLSPETEPFRNAESLALVLLLLDRFLPLGNRIQISTKEVVPEQFWSRVRGHNTVVVFTSFSTMTMAATLEPGAARPIDRLRNFSSPAALGVASCALVKPFLPQTARELPQFIQAFRDHRPRAVCVGMPYRRNTSTSSTYTHPIEAAWRSLGITTALREFTTRIGSELDIPVLHSSICVHSFLLDVEPPTPIWEDAALCVRCRACPPAS
jgi:DNA repair photolyase